MLMKLTIYTIHTLHAHDNHDLTNKVDCLSTTTQIWLGISTVQVTPQSNTTMVQQQSSMSPPPPSSWW